MTKKLINCSGESREFNAGNFIYEFPFPSDVPTEVPDDVGEKLMTTKHYKEVEIKKQIIKPETKKDLKKEMNENE